jgi:hypothetical protein
MKNFIIYAVTKRLQYTLSICIGVTCFLLIVTAKQDILIDNPMWLYIVVSAIPFLFTIGMAYLLISEYNRQ